jgi:UDP-glucuronate decarboxylase
MLRVCETLVWQHSRQFAIPVRILRLFNIYGPGFGDDDDRVIPNILRSVRSGAPFAIDGDGEQVRSFCHVTDTTDAFVRALQLRGQRQICANIGNPEPVSILELVRRVERIANRKVPIEFRPALEDEVRYRCPNIELARSCFGWSPTITLDQGVEELVQQLT